MILEEFLELFIKKGNYYIPKDPSDNVYRHFGCRVNNCLYLRYIELIYLYCKEYAGDDLEKTGYFALKNMGANIIQNDLNGRCFVYGRSKHFNRKTDSPIGVLEFREKDEKFVGEIENKIVGIKGETEVCFINLEVIRELDFKVDKKLYKKK